MKTWRELYGHHSSFPPSHPVQQFYYWFANREELLIKAWFIDCWTGQWLTRMKELESRKILTNCSNGIKKKKKMASWSNWINLIVVNLGICSQVQKASDIGLGHKRKYTSKVKSRWVRSVMDSPQKQITFQAALIEQRRWQSKPGIVFIKPHLEIWGYFECHMWLVMFSKESN